jgi:hypothetical protein
MKLGRLNLIGVATPQILPFRGRWPLKGVGGVSRLPKGTPSWETSPEAVSPLRQASPATSPHREGFALPSLLLNIIMTL